MKRRTFLQRAGWVLAALGVSETGLSMLGGNSFAVPLLDRYYQALAQPTGRKLALLVGINQYPRTTPLSGCVTDVELQRELLIHRFGVNPSDILTLTDKLATRENIETAFVEHLIEQAAEDDVVLFHFSGYGSRVNVGDLTQNALVPVDGILDGKDAPVVNNLLDETLLLLLRSLPTTHATTLLDTSYTDSNAILQGNLRIRTCSEIAGQQLSSEELAFREKLLMRLNIPPEQSNKQLQSSDLPGVILSASAPSQPAAEAAWGGFSAGLFTYALTQHLWQTIPPTTVQVSLSRTAVVVEQLVGKEQQPQLSGQKSQEESLPTYNLHSDLKMGADGVVIAVEDSGKVAQLWLAGLPTTVLPYYGVNSVLTILDSPSTSALTSESISKSLQLQVRTRDGLTARARLINTETANTVQLQVGQLIQESMRVLPRQIGLTIALDSTLERIERVDATSAFAYIPSVLSVVVAGEQAADYLFGKVQQPEKEGGYGLFSLGGKLIPNTVGEPGEAIKSAINRLVPKLEMLLAAKLWRLSVNEEASGLGVAATLERISPTKDVLAQRKTLRFKGQASQDKAMVNAELSSSVLADGGIPTLSVGSRIQYRLQNYSDRPIYYVLFGLDSSSNAIALYPQSTLTQSETSEGKPLLKDAVIEPGQTLTIPQPNASFEWSIQGQPGGVETYLICSRAPFTEAIAAMSASMRPKGERERLSDLLNPLDVARGLLQDLHQASLSVNQETSATFPPEVIVSTADSYVLDVNSWATFSFVYEVV